MIIHILELYLICTGRLGRFGLWSAVNKESVSYNLNYKFSAKCAVIENILLDTMQAANNLTISKPLVFLFGVVMISVCKFEKCYK